MDIWIIELKGKDIIISQDWLRILESMINWKKKILEINTIEEEEISMWLQDLSHVFDKFSEEEILLKRSGMDHVIELMQERISLSSLIPEKSQNYVIIREYLNEIFRREWIKISNFTMRMSMFLILKSGEKRFVIDYRKLNKITQKDSIILFLIRDILDQIQGAQWFIKIDL